MTEERNKEQERESTITPEEVDRILERSREEVERDLRPRLREVFGKPPRQIILD